MPWVPVSYWHDATGQSWYRVNIYITGVDLPKVTTATYWLPANFEPRKLEVVRVCNNQFFNIQVTTNVTRFGISAQLLTNRGTYLNLHKIASFHNQITSELKFELAGDI